jgi:hypothetical protein
MTAALTPARLADGTPLELDYVFNISMKLDRVASPTKVTINRGQRDRAQLARAGLRG